jgi:nucleoside-diphosphate-sugar epimerase
MTARILVTGAAGFIGRNALPPLVAAGREVHACTRGTAPAVAGVFWHRVDLLDPAARAALIDTVRPDTILHCAWEVEHGRFWTAPSNLDWVAASLDLMRRGGDRGLRRFVGVGSGFEYAAQTTADCDETATPTAPQTLYGIAKDACRRLIEGYARSAGLSWAWGRLFLLYGPAEAETRLVPQVARRLLAGEPAPIGPGHRPRDFMDARDAGAALAALALSPVEGPVNIASGRAATVAEVATTLGRLAGRPDLVRIGALPDRDEPERLVANVRRLTGEVGFRAIRPLEQGLGEALDWWRRHDAPLAEAAR